MNDITNVSLFYNDTYDILYIDIKYVCLGYQNYFYKLKMISP